MFDEKISNNLFKNLADGVVVIDKRGKILNVNPSIQTLFGYEEKELISRNVNILMPEPYHSNHDRYLNNYKHSSNGKVMSFGRELVAKRKDGSLFPMFLQVTEAEMEDVPVFIGVIHDITGRKLAETSYRETNNKLQAILDSAVEGMIIIDQQGIVEMANPASLRLFGYEEKEVVGKNVMMLMPEPDRSNHDHYIQEYQRTKKRKIIGIGREVLGMKKDGSSFPVRLSVGEVKLRDSVVYMGMLHDLTQELESQKQLERSADELKRANAGLEENVQLRTSELERMNESLKGTNTKLKIEVEKRKVAEENALKALYKEKELNEMKGRFVSMASHEFRTPLSGILTSVSLLDRYMAPEFEDRRKRHISTIKSSVHNLTSILNDFLNLDKLDEGQIKYNPELFPLQPLVEEYVSEIEPTCKSGQRIISSIQQGIDIVWADRHLLKNILINLTSNAIKYSKENQQMEIEFSLKDDSLKIKVVDHGIGIPVEDQPHMFERLFRASNVTNIQGTGLGLNIVKKYVDLHDGTIKFLSEPDQGTIFTVHIPQN